MALYQDLVHEKSSITLKAKTFEKLTPSFWSAAVTKLFLDCFAAQS